MKVISPFEKHADRYDQWFDRNRAVYESELKAVKHFIGINDFGTKSSIIFFQEDKICDRDQKKRRKRCSCRKTHLFFYEAFYEVLRGW